MLQRRGEIGGAEGGLGAGVHQGGGVAEDEREEGAGFASLARADVSSPIIQSVGSLLGLVGVGELDHGAWGMGHDWKEDEQFTFH